MQLMGDAIAVLGSKLGLAWEPSKRRGYLIRCGSYPGIPIEIKAGVTFNGKTIVFPLCRQGAVFGFLDQEMTPTSMIMTGIDPDTGIHVKLTITVPFQPRNEKFSIVPAVLINMSIDRLPSKFRWIKPPTDEIEGEMFIEFSGKSMEFTRQDKKINVDIRYSIEHPDSTGRNPEKEEIQCTDAITVISGIMKNNGVQGRFRLAPGDKGENLKLAWCAYDAPILNVMGSLCPFKYTSYFKNIDEVVNWIHENYSLVEKNSRTVDGIITGHSLGQSLTHLLSQTLHSWLINTWWVIKPDGTDWFSVWEGYGYFHSTVDVEYTQAPFYLSVWPELLEMELDQWPLFGVDGEKSLGPAGKDTLYLSHDVGQYCDCMGQVLWINMELESTTDYVLLAYAHWKRTGREKIITKHAEFIKKLLDYIVASDSNGNGVPDKICANTIDDGCKAIQYGPEQIYIAVKAMEACRAGAEILNAVGVEGAGKYIEFADKALTTIETLGWKGDHYVVSLVSEVDSVVNPWNESDDLVHGPLDGWDSYHIYTANGLVLLDMVGYKSKMNNDRLKQDLLIAWEKTKGRYGCRHTSYMNPDPVDFRYAIPSACAPKVGWISMNILRDIAAAYRGIDLLEMSDGYWDWQSTTNSQELKVFFETFYGNNLTFYPRGIAIYGYLDAAAGFSYDKAADRMTISPIRGSLSVPLLIFADWENGKVPILRSWIENGEIKYIIES